jgi:hypothetical protein
VLAVTSVDDNAFIEFGCALSRSRLLCCGRMQRFEAGGFVAHYDPEATAVAYRGVAQGGASICSCSGCDNFTRLRMQAYPRDFIAILATLGIDPLKEDEAYECGKDDQEL